MQGLGIIVDVVDNSKREKHSNYLILIDETLVIVVMFSVHMNTKVGYCNWNDRFCGGWLLLGRMCLHNQLRSVYLTSREFINAWS